MRPSNPDEVFGFNDIEVLRADKFDGDKTQWKTLLLCDTADDAKMVARALTACRGMEDPQHEINALRALAYAYRYRGHATLVNAVEHYFNMVGDKPTLPETVHGLLQTFRKQGEADGNDA